MRRAVLTLGGTIAGLAALFSFKTHVPGITPVAATSTPTGLSVSAPPMTSSNGSSPAASSSASASVSKTAKKTTPTAPAMTHPTTPIAPATTPASTTPTTTPPSTAPSKKPTPTPTPTPTKSSAPAAPSGTFTGTDESTNYGPVQVQLTVSDGKITAANDVQQPSDSIGANAVSQLNSEVLQAQSANVQAVSGATYTSDGYIKSLQQAVDQAGL
jgi:uncharacterized protein with FMN-binding domain